MTARAVVEPGDVIDRFLALGEVYERGREEVQYLSSSSSGPGLATCAAADPFPSFHLAWAKSTSLTAVAEGHPPRPAGEEAPGNVESRTGAITMERRLAEGTRRHASSPTSTPKDQEHQDYHSHATSAFEEAYHTTANMITTVQCALAASSDRR